MTKWAVGVMAHVQPSLDCCSQFTVNTVALTVVPPGVVT
jgi:hypothetical protein